MSEIPALLTKARRYLKSAELLLQDGDYESSASRTHYAMFYSAEAALLTRNLTFSSHRGVIGAFGKQFIKTRVFPREFGRELNRAFEMRQLGDHESTPVVSDEDARELLAQARSSVVLSSIGSMRCVDSPIVAFRPDVTGCCDRRDSLDKMVCGRTAL